MFRLIIKDAYRSEVWEYLTKEQIVALVLKNAMFAQWMTTERMQ
jgi:hypothetical protein